ncbi:MAG: DUF488 domain-containing protein [Synergistaceae bacterium]|nr:DUF488 domain-containing protein [Synergistaceae bacterium]
MTLYTIGFTKKSAEQFFELLRCCKIQVVVDVRLKNTSSLNVFTIKRDLPYFLEKICTCTYEHCANYAPTKELLTSWRKKLITWEEYEEQYKALMLEREAVRDFVVRFDGIYDCMCLLCSESTPEHCHRRLFAEMIAEQLPDTEIIHL